MAAEAAISTLLELLGEQLIQQVNFVSGVEGEVELLKDELRRMQSFLKDANKKQYEDERVRNWISEIRELALDAQDTIEMFLLNVEIAKNMSLLSKCTTFPKRMLRLKSIGHEIEKIRRKLTDIEESRKRYGIRILEEAASSSGMSQIELRRRLCPWQKDEHLVGIQDDVKKIMQESILDEKKTGLSTAVLRGLGGIGKSTLAREIYNHTDVRGKFECCAWVVVSSEFTPQETIKQLILELSSAARKELRELEESTKDEQYLLRKLQQMLHQQLLGKSYFIVLDDVWEPEHWEYFRSVFPNEEDQRGRLLVTTRNRITTEYDQYEHEMKALDLEKSWELFLKKASINGKCPDELESVGRQIVEKCHGVPLAISVAGGLLMGIRTKSGWEQFLNQVNSYLGGAQSPVSPILELSYQNLSPQLKPCFLCLAFFKEDSSINADQLINIWAAQGLIQQDGSGTIDEIGRGYLNELINRSLLQIHLNQTLDDQVQYCRIHDLLRDVCLRKAKEEMGLRSAASADESSYKTRHRVDYIKEILRTFSPEENKHLRSLFLLNVDNFWDVRTPSDYWKSFQLLKTLDLDGFGLTRLPRSFRLLLGLKYLRIHSFKLLQLPSWFDRLKKLEFFDVTYKVRFPKATLKMESLRHFRPGLIYGRPMSIDNWTNIETLYGIRPRDLVRNSSTIMASSHLRKLGIFIDEREGADVVSRAIASLKGMMNLVDLYLLCSLGTHSFAELELDASVFPPNLSRLTLVGELDEDRMEELGKLPNLMYLWLDYHGKEKGIDWRMKVSKDGFPCLETLSLRRMKDLQGMDIEEGGAPRLKRLKILQCPNLDTQNLPEHIIISYPKFYITISLH